MITPIEMYSMMPKSQEASNVRHAEQTKGAAQQAGIAQQIEKTATDNTHRTVKMSEAENPEYRYDAKEKGNNEYSSEGEKKKKQKEEEHAKGPENRSPRPGGIDIRI